MLKKWTAVILQKLNLPSAARPAEKKVIVSAILIALCLTMIRYLGDYHFVRTTLIQFNFLEFVQHTDSFLLERKAGHLPTLLYWASVIILFYLIVPSLFIRFYFKERVSSYGIQWKGAFKDIKTYFLLLAFMLPLVIYFSHTPAFQQRYPFYQAQSSADIFPNLLIWELFYIAQFFALEFFFRGFMLYLFEKVIGSYAVLVMMIPYCMIHFGKPLPETIGAIFAGLILGYLSLKSRSVLPGFLIHVGVALTMDIASLYQKGLLY